MSLPCYNFSAARSGNGRHIAPVMALLAFVLLFVSRLQLGRAFSIAPRASIMVTAGIYARIRKKAELPAVKFGNEYFEYSRRPGSELKRRPALLLFPCRQLFP